MEFVEFVEKIGSKFAVRSPWLGECGALRVACGEWREGEAVRSS